MQRAGKMSDEKLRRDLIALGFTPGPITDGTRKVLEKKLVKLRAEAKKEQNRRRSRRQETPSDSDEGDGDIPDSRSVGSSRHTSDIQESRSQYTSDIQESSSFGSIRYTSDIPEGRSLGSHRYTSDNPESRSLGSHRYTSDNPESRSLGLHRYTSDIPERKSLGSHRYTSDIPEGRSLGSHRYTSDIPESRSLGSHRYTSDIPESRSLGSHRYTSDIPESRSLGSHRYTSDIPESRSLGSHRYTSDIPESRSLGSHRYTSDIPESRSLGSHRYTSDIPEGRPLGSHRYTSDIPESRSFGSSDGRSLGSQKYTSDILGFCSYPVDELRYRHLGDSSRDTSAYISNSRTAIDALSHKSPLDLRQENALHLKPLWSKNLEYYLSRLLRVLCVILVLVFTGILIVKSGVLSTSQDNGAKLLPADCEGKKDLFCKAKQKEITLQILSELYDFLSLEAGRFECGNPSGLSSKCIPINTAKEHVMNVSGYAADRFEAALDWLLSNDTHLGIWAKAEDTEELVAVRADVFCVESSRPRLGIVCRLRNALYTAISNLFLALLGIFLLWLILIFLRYHWQSLEEEEKQMFVLVDKIIGIVKHHHMDWILQREQNPYLVISHVRDSLIEPKDRKHLKRIWDRAVQFVENDSRVRTESQRVAGADLMVWRWTQSRKEYPR
ncbi:LEM domain-containing protein 2 isoform X2 [Ranitomeya variabilis]|uniref:LEM domain-containing protein 2 isoform X2 n=1 Tax=Ranitomeya variabilis TaxID=490064 RepID=UPI0040579E81